MGKQQLKLRGKTFVRSFTAVKGEERLQFTAQPYCVGMYTVLSVPAPQQAGVLHSGYARWVKKLMTAIRKDGFTIEEIREIPYEQQLDAAQLDMIEGVTTNG